MQPFASTPPFELQTVLTPAGNRHVDLVGHGIGSDGMGIVAGNTLVCRDHVRVRLDVAAGLLVAAKAGQVGIDDTE